MLGAVGAHPRIRSPRRGRAAMAMAMAMAAAALAPAMGRCVDGSGACASGRPAAGPRPLARGASHADVGRWAERGRGRAVRATRTLAVAAAVGSGRDVVADARTNFRLLIGEAEGGREVPLFMRNRYFETLSGEIRVALGEEEIMIAAQKGARALAEAKQKQAEIERAVSALKRVVLAGSPTGATGEVEGEGVVLGAGDLEALAQANDVLARIIVARGGTAADGSTDSTKLGGADDNEVSSLLLDGMNLSGDDKKMATSFLEGAGVQAVNSAFFGTMAGAGLILVYVLLNAGK